MAEVPRENHRITVGNRRTALFSGGLGAHGVVAGERVVPRTLVRAGDNILDRERGRGGGRGPERL